MAVLTTEERGKLPDSDFALAGRQYPINDEIHARNALARVAQFGTPAEQTAVRAKVHRRYPEIGEHEHHESPTQERAERHSKKETRMGRSTTPKYRIELVVDGKPERMAWDMHYGRPSEENLEKYVQAYIKSMYVGGANEHISKAIGHVPVPNSARIVTNTQTGQLVADWKAPAFMVMPEPDRKPLTDGEARAHYQRGEVFQQAKQKRETERQARRQQQRDERTGERIQSQRVHWGLPLLTQEQLAQAVAKDNAGKESRKTETREQQRARHRAESHALATEQHQLRMSGALPDNTYTKILKQQNQKIADMIRANPEKEVTTHTATLDDPQGTKHTLTAAEKAALLRDYPAQRTIEDHGDFGITPAETKAIAAGSPAIKAQMERRAHKAQQAAGATTVMAQLRAIEKNRSSRSRAMDESKTNQTVISPRDTRVRQWKNHPDTMDVQGIDTPAEAKAMRLAGGLPTVFNSREEALKAAQNHISSIGHPTQAERLAALQAKVRANRPQFASGGVRVVDSTPSVGAFGRNVKAPSQGGASGARPAANAPEPKRGPANGVYVRKGRGATTYAPRHISGSTKIASKGKRRR